MSVYKMARELGENILQTKEGKRFYDAAFIYEGDEEAKRILSEYTLFKQNVQLKCHDKNISKEELDADFERLNQMSLKAEENPVVAELMASEKEFNALINTVLEILKGTIFKEQNGCSGNCSSCGGCH